jgi:hypothetical protein
LWQDSHVLQPFHISTSCFCFLSCNTP